MIPIPEIWLFNKVVVGPSFNMVKIESRPQTISDQVEISHQLCESQEPEKVKDLYVQSIYSV